jgi:hypothetical protein
MDVPAYIEIYGSGGLLSTSQTVHLSYQTIKTYLPLPQQPILLVSVNMFNKKGSFIGVCRFEIWNMVVLQPYFFAAYALFTNANVVFDKAPNITFNGAVARDLSPSSHAAFFCDLPSR